LRSTKAIAYAVDQVYWFRQGYGLEDVVYSYLLWYPELKEEDFASPIWEEYSDCSSPTQELVNIYSTYISNGTYENPLRYYPLLDRIAAWMDETYQ